MKPLTKIELLLIFGLLFNSCREYKTSDKETATNDLQGSWLQTTKSENFLDYSKFIIENPESEYLDSAIARYIYYQDLHWDTVEPVGDCFGNCINIRFNRLGQLLYNFRVLDIDSLRIKSFEFLVDNNNNPEYPEKKQILDLEGRNRFISKGYFEIIYVKDSCPDLIEVVKEISLTIKGYSIVIIMTTQSNI